MFPSKNKEQKQSYVLQIMKEPLQTVCEVSSRKEGICAQALFAAAVHNDLFLL